MLMEAEQRLQNCGENHTSKQALVELLSSLEWERFRAGCPEPAPSPGVVGCVCDGAKKLSFSQAFQIAGLTN